MVQIEHRHRKENLAVDLIRSLVFGFGHGLISTLGLSIGVVFATESVRPVVISGLIGMISGLFTMMAL